MVVVNATNLGENAVPTISTEHPFLVKHADKIHGVLSCFDRVILRGYLPLSYPFEVAPRCGRNIRFSALAFSRSLAILLGQSLTQQFLEACQTVRVLAHLQHGTDVLPFHVLLDCQRQAVAALPPPPLPFRWFVF
jgi:hypothetical protein